MNQKYEYIIVSKDELSTDIFSYGWLKEKAKREIRRLVESENCANETDALDNALNAAFSIYHLIQWKDKEANPSSSKKVHELLEGAENNGLKTLHSVVIRNKHVTVTAKFNDNDGSLKIKDDCECLCTEDGEQMAAEDGQPLVTEDSKITVYFDNEEALIVLNEAMQAFCGNK